MIDTVVAHSVLCLIVTIDTVVARTLLCLIVTIDTDVARTVLSLIVTIDIVVWVSEDETVFSLYYDRLACI